MPSIRPTRRVCKCIVFLLLLASALPALAIDSICVGSSAALHSAMVAAQSAPKQIKLSQGTYSLDDFGLFIPQPGTSLEGGYAAGCGTRQIAAGNTTLTASGQTFFEPIGDLTLEGLTFQMQQGLDVKLADNFVPGSQVTVRRDEFKQSGASYYGGVLSLKMNVFELEDVEPRALIVDSLFVGNTATDSTCVIELQSHASSTTFTLVNNTVFGNVGGGICMRNYPGDAPGNGSLFAYNNIIYDNNGGDIYTDTANLELKWNTYATFIGPAPTTESFTQHGDPKLDANFRPVTSPASPVINSGAPDGNPDLPLHDLDGGPRVVGTHVDRGVYESNIDDAYKLTVKNVNDGGTDSLRAAIASANANGSGRISFEIPGDCTPAHVINLGSALPAISSAVIIDGYSQSGASQNDLLVGDDANICVVLDGAGILGNGLLVNPNPPANTQLTVSGLGFSGFVDAAINLSGGSGHAVQGNHIGGKVNGITLAPSGYGVYVEAGVSGVAIGGSDLADRNIVGDATLDGIRLQGTSASQAAATANTVANNYVGVGWNNAAFVDHGNAKKGIHVLGSNNRITGNTVGFNTSDGIDLDGTDATANVIENNFIGIAADANDVGQVMSNAVGVRIENGAHDNKIRSNAIQDNLGPGVRVVSGKGNTIRFNAIDSNGFSNPGGALGIDIAGLGVTDIDDDASALDQSQANRGLNFPEIALATGAPSAVAIAQGLLQSTPGDYYIDAYLVSTCDSSGHGEGLVWLASTKITIGPSDTSAPFSLPIGDFLVPQNWTITATATDAASNPSPGNTSEFSACKAISNDRVFAGGFDPAA